MLAKHRLTAYELCIAAYGLSVGVHALVADGLPDWPISLFFLLGGLALMRIVIVLPSGAQYSPVLPIAMAALLVHGLPLASLLVGSGVAWWRVREGRSLPVILFGAGQVVVSAQWALFAYAQVRAWSALVAPDVLAILIATLVFDLVNLALNVVWASLKRNSSWWQLFTHCLFRDRSVFVIPYHLLTLLTCLLYMDRGFLGLATSLVCVAALKLILEFQNQLSDDNLQARRDHLTGAFNPRFLQEWLEVHGQPFTDKQCPCTIFFIDMDGLKELNDEFGHEVGDLAIVHLTNLLRSNMRSQDLLVRYGGDEFVIVCPDMNANLAHEVAYRMQAAGRAQPLCHGGSQLPLFFSVGSASFPEEHNSVDLGLVRQADRAMYLAKVSGEPWAYRPLGHEGPPPSAPTGSRQ